MSITYNEILDTFNALNKTKVYLENTWGDIEAFLKKRDRIVFIGCGSSYCIAKSMAGLCFMSAGRPSAALTAGDVIMHAERYKKAIDGAAVVFVSRSGRTSELLMALEALESQSCDMAVASLVCADDTPLEAKSDFALSMPWAYDESVCQTRCVTNFYYAAAYIAARITGDRIVLDDLDHVLDGGDGYIKQAEQLAEEISRQNWTHVAVLADAELEGLAEEGSLVFKEVCQIPSNCYHMLDVRHGPMVLVNKESLILTVTGYSEALENAFINDIIEKGALVVAFSNSSAGIDRVQPGATGGLRLLRFNRPLSYIASGIPFVILCQMVALYKSKVTGTDPDNPTGLQAWISLPES